MTGAPGPTRMDLHHPAETGRVTPLWVGDRLDRFVAEELSRQRLGYRYALITDPRVAARHAAPLEAALRDAGLEVERLVFAGGERGKTRAAKADLEDRLFEAGFGRDAAIVALGGGVVGDVAGFVAATYHRGIPWVALPTTLLAMVDASIGGKTAVDLPAGKNLIGAFHPPAAVYADLAALDSLPDERLREGFAEVLKHALVADAGLATFLDDHASDLLGRRPGPLRHAVEVSIRVKAAIVAEDPREAQRRAVLNFGHTVAHALESATAYGMSHGDAVGIGLVVEADLSATRGLLQASEVATIRRLVGRFGLPTRVPPGLEVDGLVERCEHDKKARRGAPRVALLRRIGAAAGSAAGWTFAVTREELRDAFRRSQESPGG
jgi:3-dehydroquinate synthase